MESACGQIIKRERTRRGLSQQHLADWVTVFYKPVTQTWIARTESGSRPIYLRDIEGIARSLGQSELDWIAEASNA